MKKISLNIPIFIFVAHQQLLSKHKTFSSNSKLHLLVIYAVTVHSLVIPNPTLYYSILLLKKAIIIRQEHTLNLLKALVQSEIINNLTITTRSYKQPTKLASRCIAVCRCPLLYCSAGRQSITKYRTPSPCTYSKHCYHLT